jgi:hypothetical protein
LLSSNLKIGTPVERPLLAQSGHSLIYPSPLSANSRHREA